MRCLRYLLVKLLIGLLVLPASSCDAVSTWMAGVDPDSYSWAELLGTTHKNTWDKDLRDCEAPSGQAASTGEDAPTAGATITITRSENAQVVATCMFEKGYSKDYETRTGLF